MSRKDIDIEADFWDRKELEIATGFCRSYVGKNGGLTDQAMRTLADNAIELVGIFRKRFSDKLIAQQQNAAALVERIEGGRE